MNIINPNELKIIILFTFINLKLNLNYKMEKIQVAIRFRPLIKKQRDIWCINTQLSQIYIDPEVKLDDKKINLGQL